MKQLYVKHMTYTPHTSHPKNHTGYLIGLYGNSMLYLLHTQGSSSLTFPARVGIYENTWARLDTPTRCKGDNQHVFPWQHRR